ncbi:MAG TPA: transporter substrate-binding domain-containing protein [Gammaproteobacteria bacterium]|nr:transporter substrate-binding domain-containing protein [Gammaproteobacteria bacterium]
MSNPVALELAPTGTLRAAINLANFLLVTGKKPNGDPDGVAPDLAAVIAEDLGVDIKYVPFATPGELADAVSDGSWDIGLIGAEPARAEHIDFTAAYVEIEATYLVLTDSPLKQLEDVDRLGIRIAVSARSAYDLYLTRHLKHAELVRAEGLDASYELFVREGLDALAGLKPRLLSDVETLGQARLLEGRFTAVQQAVGTPAGRHDGAAYLRSFIETAKASGLVAQLISRHQVKGLSVAPAV